MELTEHLLKKAYEPYVKLAFYYFSRYTLFIAGINIVFLILMGMEVLVGPYPWFMVISIYLLLCLSAFWIVLLSLVERKKGYYETTLVEVCWIETDGLYGNYKNSNQEIKKCYPKEVAAERDKLICRNVQGKKVIYRMIGSKKKMKRIKQYFVHTESRVYITYGKLTKVILRFESVEEKDSMRYNNVKWLNRMF